MSLDWELMGVVGRRGVRAGLVAVAVVAGGLAPGAVAAEPVAAEPVVSAVAVSSFTDVPDSSPFFTEISWLVTSGVTTGYPDGGFHPTAAVSRQAMAAFLYRYAGSPEYTPPVTSPFADVDATNTLYTEICWLAETGITGGYADGGFHPTAAVSRQAMAAFLYRFAGEPGFTAPVTSPFADVDASNAFYLAVTWLADTGITGGYADGGFHPTAAVSRQAMAAFLYRYNRATTLVSAGFYGHANNVSYSPSVSADGRWITYYSLASTLVPGDTNSMYDVFVTDRITGVTTLISAGPNGSANGRSWHPSISADGRWISYNSEATNLVAGDTNATWDVFVTDRTTGATTLVSAGVNGPANDSSTFNSLSADGRWITFSSNASNLVAGDTNGCIDVFLTDRTTGTTTLVSVGANGPANNGSTTPSISADGRWITYNSDATDLVAGDTNSRTDVFVTDRITGVTTLISAGTNGPANNGSQRQSISDDGRWITYDSDATNLVAGDTDGRTDVFVTDRTTGATTLISIGIDGPANGVSWNPSISSDGRWIAYTSEASNLVAGDTNGTYDVFLTDRTTGATTLISGASDRPANDRSYFPSISPDGRWIAYNSDATNLVAGDTNGWADVFVTANPLLP